MEAESMSSVLASVSTRKEKAAKAMACLHGHRDLLTACITEWEELERSFGIAERALQQKFKELAERELEYDRRMKDVQAALDKREESISGREDASLAHVREQKAAAMASLVEERRKLEEEQLNRRETKNDDMQVSKGVNANFCTVGQVPNIVGSGKEGQESETDKCELPVATESKQIQKKKDSRVVSSSQDTTDALKKAGGKPSSPSVHHKKEKELQVQKSEDRLLKDKRKDVRSVDETATKRRRRDESPLSEAMAIGSPSNDESSDGAPSVEEVVDQVQLAAGASLIEQVEFYVNQMDGDKLRALLAKNHNHHQEIKPSLQRALLACTDPCRLVLTILEGSEGTTRMSKNNNIGHACILLLECLSEVVADPVLGVDHPVVPSNVKELVKTLARHWKVKLDLQGQSGFVVDSHLFLQLLATFGIGSEYNNEELLKYVISMSRAATGPALCRTLGLTHMVPVLIEKLVKQEKQIEGIAFASAFGLLEKFRPDALLESYLETSKKSLQTGSQLSKWNLPSKIHAKQVAVLKTASKVIEEYNLSSQFPLEDLRNRIAGLTQKKEENKKGSSTMKQDEKPKSPTEVELRRPNGATVGGGGDGRLGLDVSALSYGGSCDTGHYTLGHSNKIDYLPTNLRQSSLPSFHGDINRFERRPNESLYGSYGLGRVNPVPIPNSYGHHPSRESFMSGPMSHLPSYSGMSRGEFEMLSGRLSSYSGVPGLDSSYHPGPSSLSYPPRR